MSDAQPWPSDVRQRGQVRWIGVRPKAGEAIIQLDAVEARREAGLTGDHARPGAGNPRQVTLLQWEHLAVINALLASPADKPIGPIELRRNLAVSGINLFSLKGRCFRIGQAILQTTGWCHPCAKLQAHLGPGSLQALRGHAGITARVVRGGIIRLHDTVEVEPG